MEQWHDAHERIDPESITCFDEDSPPISPINLNLESRRLTRSCSAPASRAEQIELEAVGRTPATSTPTPSDPPAPALKRKPGRPRKRVSIEDLTVIHKIRKCSVHINNSSVPDHLFSIAPPPKKAAKQAEGVTVSPTTLGTAFCDEFLDSSGALNLPSSTSQPTEQAGQSAASRQAAPEACGSGESTVQSGMFFGQPSSGGANGTNAAAVANGASGTGGDLSQPQAASSGQPASLEGIMLMLAGMKAKAASDFEIASAERQGIQAQLSTVNSRLNEHDKAIKELQAKIQDGNGVVVRPSSFGYTIREKEEIEKCRNTVKFMPFPVQAQQGQGESETALFHALKTWLTDKAGFTDNDLLNLGKVVSIGRQKSRNQTPEQSPVLVQFDTFDAKGFVLSKKPHLKDGARMFNMYPPCLVGLKRRLDKDVDAIQAKGGYQAHVRYVLGEHYLEVFVRETRPGAGWMSHRQAKRFQPDNDVLPPPSGAEFF